MKSGAFADGDHVAGYFFFVVIAAAPQGKGCEERQQQIKGENLYHKIDMFFRVRSISAVGVDGNEKYRNICLC